MVPQSWIINCPQNVQTMRWYHKLYRENHENQKNGIDSRRGKLSWSEGPKIYISRRCTITVFIHNCEDATYILWKCTAGYKSEEKINYLMYMNDIKMKKRIGNPNTDSENIQSRYRNEIWRWKMRHARNDKRQTAHDRSRTIKSWKIRELIEKETYKNLGILEADTIKQVDMNEKIKTEYPRRRKPLEIKLYGRNLVKGINTWTVFFVPCSGPFLKWTREELKQINQRTRKSNEHV